MFLQRRTFTRTSPPVSGLFQTFIFTHRFSRKFAFCGGVHRSTCSLQKSCLNFPDLWPGGSLHWWRRSMLYLSIGSFKWLICSPSPSHSEGFYKAPGNYILITPFWPAQSWFPDLHQLNVRVVRRLPLLPNLVVDLQTGLPPHLCSILYNLFG